MSLYEAKVEVRSQKFYYMLDRNECPRKNFHLTVKIVVVVIILVLLLLLSSSSSRRDCQVVRRRVGLTQAEGL